MNSEWVDMIDWVAEMEVPYWKIARGGVDTERIVYCSVGSPGGTVRVGEVEMG